MNELLDLVWRYQFYLLPLAVGLGVGVLAVTTGAMALSRKRRGAQDAAQRKQPEYDPFTQGSLTEQRKAYRRNGNPVEVIYHEVEKKHYTRNAVVLDRSVSGLRLGLDQEIAEGKRLMVMPANVTGLTPWTEVEIRICRKVGDSWEAGCSFVKSPPWSVLLMFG